MAERLKAGIRIPLSPPLGINNLVVRLYPILSFPARNSVWIRHLQKRISAGDKRALQIPASVL